MKTTANADIYDALVKLHAEATPPARLTKPVLPRSGIEPRQGVLDFVTHDGRIGIVVREDTQSLLRPWGAYSDAVEASEMQVGEK